MKSSFGIRLWFLIAALVAVAGATIYELSSAGHRVQQLESKLTTDQIESFQLASNVRRDLLALNDSLLYYALVRDPQQWSQFEQAGSNLDHWLDDHDPSLNPRSVLASKNEREIFQAINHAYDDYLGAARAVHSNAQPALVSMAQLSQLDDFNARSRQMTDLVGMLSEAHRAAETGFVADTTATLKSLRNILLAGVVMLLVLIAAMGRVIYRDMVAPLRLKLVRSQDLLERQEKLATLGTLAAGIAHEIRNPLTSLKARLYTLEKHLLAVPAARKDTDIISAEISRLEHIVQDILSFARPSEPKLAPLAADTLLREIQGLMSTSLESRGVKLMVETGPGLMINADSARLKQVLINLVRNGAEAIDGAGTVTLRPRAARAQLRGRETDVVILEVADTGKGIPAEARKRLFDPFFSTKETGTGLGLSIAARIIETHGGMIQFQTQPGHGTTFGVVLPREINDNVRRATQDAKPLPGDGKSPA